LECRTTDDITQQLYDSVIQPFSVSLHNLCLNVAFIWKADHDIHVVFGVIHLSCPFILCQIMT